MKSVFIVQISSLTTIIQKIEDNNNLEVTNPIVTTTIAWTTHPYHPHQVLSF